MAEAISGRRILMTTDAVGGVWTYSLDLARELCRSGYEVVLATMGPAAAEAQRDMAKVVPGLTLFETGLPLDWLAESPEQVAEASARIGELAGDHGCGLVQLHAAGLAVNRNFQVPVLTMHHSCMATWWRAVRKDAAMPEDFRWHLALATRGLAASDAVVAPTTAHAHAVAAAYALREPPLAIANGRAAPGPAAEAARERFVMTSGRLWDDAKNLAALDRAAALLDVPVVAAGSTSGPHGARASFAHLQLPGSLEEAEVRLMLSKAPVYTSTALYEPFGLGVLEAAQAGCALVLADIPSFRETWSGAALFVPPHDERAIAAALTRVLSEPTQQRVLSERAKRRAAQFTAEAMAKQMMRLYGSLIALHHAGRGAAA